MKRGATGRYETSTSGGETVRAFVPAPLPPDPMLDLHGERQRLLERALLACGRLDGVRALLPDPNRFLTCSSSSSTKHRAYLSMMWWRSRATLLPWSTAWQGCAGDSRSPTACCARYTRSCSEVDGGRTSSPESFAAARTGWEAPVPATRDSCRLRPSASRTAWPRSSVPSTPGTKVYRYS